MSRLRDWFGALEQREQRVLLAGAGILLVLLLYVLIWQPLQSRHERAANGVVSGQATLGWMLEAAAEVRALQGSGTSAGNGLEGRSLLAVVDQSARRTGLGDALKRVEPEGAGAVRVWLEAASFDQMIGWLAGLSQQQGVQVDVISIERGDATGRVNARLTLQGPTS